MQKLRMRKRGKKKYLVSTENTSYSSELGEKGIKAQKNRPVKSVDQEERKDLDPSRGGSCRRGSPIRGERIYNCVPGLQKQQKDGGALLQRSGKKKASTTASQVLTHHLESIIQRKKETRGQPRSIRVVGRKMESAAKKQIKEKEKKTGSNDPTRRLASRQKRGLGLCYQRTPGSDRSKIKKGRKGGDRNRVRGHCHRVEIPRDRGRRTKG